MVTEQQRSAGGITASILRYFIGETYCRCVPVACLVCWASLSAAAPSVELVGRSTVDFGRYPERVAKEATFRLRNAGDEELEITRLRKTCGCFDVSCEKRMVPPQGQTTVTVTLKPHSIQNGFTKSVFVETSDPVEKCLRLSISGHAVPLVEVRPASVVGIGKRSPTAPWRQRFALIPSEADVEFGPPEVEGTHTLAVDIGQKDEGETAGSAIVEVRAVGTLAEGVLRCTMLVPCLRPPGTPPVKLILHGEIVSTEEE